MGKLIIEGNSVYEIDEACIQRKERQEKNQKNMLEPPDRRRYQKGTRR